MPFIDTSQLKVREPQTWVAGPGSVAIVPPNTAHSVKALSDGRSIVVDYPLRDSVGGVDTD